MKKTIIWVVVILVLVAGGWYLATNWGGGMANSGPAVATVGGEKISKGDFEAIRDQAAKAQGLDLATLAEAEAKQFNDQILESLISQRLLLQAASKKGVNVSDADIKSQLALISEQFGGEEAMQAAVLEQGYTTAELNDQIKNDLVIKAYLKQLFAGAELTASEDEIATLYEQFSAGSEDSPELEEVRSDIESFVLQQKEQDYLHMQKTEQEELKLMLNIKMLKKQEDREQKFLLVFLQEQRKKEDIDIN